VRFPSISLSSDILVLVPGLLGGSDHVVGWMSGPPPALDIRPAVAIQKEKY
jgi:hypothetical protein